MVGRGEQTDAAWAESAPLLGANGQRDQQWRGIATRHEKRTASYRALVVIVSLMIWIRE